MKKRITAIFLILVMVLALTACGGNNTTSESESFQMPLGLNYGDSNETVKNAISEVGKLQDGVAGIENTGDINDINNYTLADKDTYSYLGYDWDPLCSVFKDKLFLIVMYSYVPHDDYEVIVGELEKKYGEPNKNKENIKEWNFENEEITCEFRPEGPDTPKECVCLTFLDIE